MYTSNLNNLILNSDSYKTSHWVQYPSGSEYLSSYIEARKGDYDVVFFGLQAFIKEYLSTPITHQDIDEAEMVIQAHGLTFNRAGWELISMAAIYHYASKPFLKAASFHHPMWSVKSSILTLSSIGYQAISKRRYCVQFGTLQPSLASRTIAKASYVRH